MQSDSRFQIHHIRTISTQIATRPRKLSSQVPSQTATLPSLGRVFWCEAHPYRAICRVAFTNATQVSWPAGNSGIAAFFEPQNGVNGSLTLSLANSSAGHTLEPVYVESDEHPTVGITAQLELNSSATLVLPILGSIRVIRDFAEGPSLLYPTFQDAIEFTEDDDGGVALSRLWLDNTTTTSLFFQPAGNGSLTLADNKVKFTAGAYNFNATFNYPQLERLGPSAVLNEASQDLIEESPPQVDSLSFLSYSDKLLAGGWRFYTYFGRDDMISMLLMSSILSSGENSALEAGISSVLERINRTDGSAAHEESIGDYATWLNQQEDGVASTAPRYDYHMIDTDYFVPIILVDYLVKNEVGHSRAEDFLAQEASTNPENSGLTYRELALINAEKIMSDTAAFAAKGGQKKENLIHLKDGEAVGEWRDSNNGLGGGRIPYNVNTAIVPAGLRAVAALAGEAYFPEHPEWEDAASKAAQVWEDETLGFFEVIVPLDEAKDLLDDYVESNDLPFPAESGSLDASNITGNHTDALTFYAVALNNDGSPVRVMNTDDCLRHFLLNTTDQAQLSSYLSQTADHILRPFPAGLTTDVGLLVANPAYGDTPSYAENFTSSAYHGTVVWSWQLAMMAAGLERQLDRCTGDEMPEFCDDGALREKILAAYNRLWDVIDENRDILSSEMWSWRYEGDKFVYAPLGDLPPPPGVSPTESNAIQLWSLTFLAVRRNEAFK